MNKKEPMILGHRPDAILLEEIRETVEYGDKDRSRQAFRKVVGSQKGKAKKRGRKS
ncbi:hypothetical protein [Exiguobacterium sp.]|uniref:hypothetical protein n=1 Tax=Exiguobacterium sp. TaxID=44751 RepID=UPI00289AB032|nr:hypothetical protein [Exiguobacterium sp.]